MATTEMNYIEGGEVTLSTEYVTGTWNGSSPYLTIATTKKASGFFLTVVYSGNSYCYACVDETSAILQNGTTWKSGGVDVMAQFNDNNIYVNQPFSSGANDAYKCYVLYTD